LAFLFILQIYEKSHCEHELSTENKRRHNKEKREKRKRDLERVIEHKNQSEVVKTVVTEIEPIKKLKGENAFQQIKRRSSIVLNNSIQKIFGDKAR
jgi:hypothetical protein